MHIVVFTTSEGKPGYFQTETLDDALKFVERVRNTEGVDDAKLYRMTEVPLSVRTYVKVEVAGSGGMESSEAGMVADEPTSNGAAAEAVSAEQPTF